MFLTPIGCKELHRAGCGEQQDPGPPMLSTIKSGISTGNLPPDLRVAEVTQWPHMHSQCRVGRGEAQREPSPPHLSIFASLSLWASIRYFPKYLDVLTPFSSYELLWFKVDTMLTFPSYRWGDWDPEKLRSLRKITCYDQQPQGSRPAGGPQGPCASLPCYAASPTENGFSTHQTWDSCLVPSFPLPAQCTTLCPNTTDFSHLLLVLYSASAKPRPSCPHRCIMGKVPDRSPCFQTPFLQQTFLGQIPTFASPFYVHSLPSTRL